ncbi:short-chain dehydrogenase/reductase SDR [Serendipita vermifera]|nr:short-chain dehydrogenase/reductase SDR [Serendipita vermifera]
MASKPIIIIAGVGNAAGTGAATAKEFSKVLGYRVALVARRLKDLEAIAQEINQSGGEAHSFPLKDYNHEEINAVFEAVKEHWPNSKIKVALWNASQWSRIPFMDVTEQDIQKSVQINIVAAFAWSQQAIKAMLSPSSPDGSFSDENPGGTLLFTGATSGTRGAAQFATFAAGKHGLRALSQSLAREFGKANIHVAHVIVDGVILTKKTREMFGGKKRVVQTPGATDDGEDWMDDDSRRLNPESIAKAFIWLHQQDHSAWTLELDMRPAKEHF